MSVEIKVIDRHRSRRQNVALFGPLVSIKHFWTGKLAVSTDGYFPPLASQPTRKYVAPSIIKQSKLLAPTSVASYQLTFVNSESLY